VSAAQVATDATATHGTAEVPTKAPTHASAEVTTTHRAAEVATAHASAPMTARVATGRNGAGRDDGTSQCHGNNDARDSMHPHDGVSVPNDSTMGYAVCVSGIKRCREQDVFTASDKHLLDLATVFSGLR
jgi:hypothetical protein